MRIDFGLLRQRHDLTPAQFRTSGIICVVLAAAILALTLFLALALAVTGFDIDVSGLMPDGMRVDREEQRQAGSPGLYIGMGLILTVLFAYGILALVQGIWQIVFRSRHERVITAMVWIVYSILLAGAVASLAMGRVIGLVGQ
ncbi:MAG: hypothetical protein AB7O49_02075 [Sphingomonadales bacterium]